MSGDTWHEHVDATGHPRGVTHGMIHVVPLFEWLTWSLVSRGGNMGKENNKKKSRKNVRVISGKGGSGGKFPQIFDNLG